MEYRILQTKDYMGREMYDVVRESGHKIGHIERIPQKDVPGKIDFRAVLYGVAVSPLGIYSTLQDAAKALYDEWKRLTELCSRTSLIG